MSSALVIQSKDRLVGMNSAILEANELLNLLNADVSKHAKDCLLMPQQENAEIQSSRRNYVRACFASIEANVFSLKRLALLFPETLQVEDQAFCNEVDSDLDSNGDIRNRKKKLSFMPNLRYAFDVFSRAYQLSERPDYGNSTFGLLQNSIAMRDRLTHPKNTGDLNVASDEMIRLAQGYSWFLAEMHRLVSLGMEKLIIAIKSAT
jgi:hypothetical protein